MPIVTTSGSYNYYSNRDAIITRALRIVNAIGQGESPTATQITEAAEPLNDIVKEFVTTGMPMWNSANLTITPVQGVINYQIYPGAIAPNVNAAPFQKINFAYLLNIATQNQTPLTQITNIAYNMLPNKTTQGRPTQLYFTGGTNNTYGGSGGEQAAAIYVWPAPDALTASDYQIVVSGHRAFQDFDAAADLPDFPAWWTNALKWALADQLAYEYGLPLAERAMITRKAENHLLRALSFGMEEGSLFLQPDMSGR